MADPQPNEPTSRQLPGTSTSTSPSGPAELADHDYTRQPNYTPFTDHNYFMSVPLPDPAATATPPGFNSHGRPQRTRKTPSKFSDYDLS